MKGLLKGPASFGRPHAGWSLARDDAAALLVLHLPEQLPCCNVWRRRYPVLTPCLLQIVVSFGNETIGQHETSFPSNKRVPLPGPNSTYIAQGPNISAFEGQLDGVCWLVHMTGALHLLCEQPCWLTVC